MTQRDLADVFGQTPANVSHYEIGKQEFPPACARALIAAAKGMGRDLTFDEIYGSPKVGAGDTAPAEPESITPARALACASQSVRLTADRRQITRRAPPTEEVQPDQLPLGLDL